MSMITKRRMRPAVVQSIAIVMLCSGVASAQSTAADRVAVTVAAGVQTTATSFSQSITFEAFSEQGSVAANYAIKHPPVADAGIAIRLWRGLGVGIAGTYAHDSFPAHVIALIPHPLVVNQPRTISGDAGVGHRELAAHLEALYDLERGRHLDVQFSAGPSLFRTDQDFVADVTYTQVFPYDTATYEGAAVNRQRQTVWGFNVGAEAGWKVAGPFGLSAIARYSRAVYHLPAIGADTVTAGGLNLEGGVRLLF